MADPYALLKNAKKIYDGASSPWNFFSKNEKLEEAAETYTRAANAFRMKQLDKEAGQAFEEAAKIQLNNLNEADDAANTMLEAFKVYRKQDPADAARCLTQAINRYTSNGNFRRAATHMEKLAETYEEMGEKVKAMESFETAGTWYETDNAEALAQRNYLKVADLAVLSGDYSKALGHYEKAAVRATGNTTMRFSLNKYLLNSGLCLLAIGDMVAVNRGIEKYKGMDPNFEFSDEGKLLMNLAQAVEEGDDKKAEDAMWIYCEKRPRDAVMEKILLFIKTALQEKDEDFS